jgi:hypothetical protein
MAKKLSLTDERTSRRSQFFEKAQAFLKAKAHLGAALYAGALPSSGCTKAPNPKSNAPGG